MSKLMLSCVFLLPAFGCVAIDSTDDSAPEETFTRTIVRIADDGSATVTTEPVTATEQRLEHEAAVAELANARTGVKPYSITVDSCADWYPTKFFDQPDYTGNELCVLGNGTGFYLHQFCRIRGYRGLCLRTWSESTQSLWTGENVVWLTSVYFASTTCPGGIGSGFPAYEADATVDDCVQISDEFELGPAQ